MAGHSVAPVAVSHLIDEGGSYRLLAAKPLDLDDHITWDTGVATVAGAYSIGRDTNDHITINVPTGKVIDFAINGTDHFHIDATTGFYASNANAGAVLNEAASQTNPTLVPDRSDVTTGIGKTGALLDLIVSGAAFLELGGGLANFKNNAAVNLGSAGNDFSSSGLALDGALAMTEMTAPTGAANIAKLFAQDNGAGKTQLMVIFGTGSAIQLAVEA
ncbi:MAG: hypothetical protein FJ317_03875 [SAR202 cluster bacterium]|nr:hypothetical protein [SAR202 cluster bacterium]